MQAHAWLIVLFFLQQDCYRELLMGECEGECDMEDMQDSRIRVPGQDALEDLRLL